MKSAGKILPYALSLFLSVAGLSRGIGNYATKILPSTSWVEAPYKALGNPDEQYAGIQLFGNLDMEFGAENREGNDIRIYARRSTVEFMPGTMTYYVFGKETEGDDWMLIGVGGGQEPREEFDLGDLKRISKIQLVFANSFQKQVRPLTPEGTTYRMDIDAVEAIH